MAKTGRQSFQFMLRLPDELREQLKAVAETAGRSVTAEIIARLEQSFGDGFAIPDQQMKALRNLAASLEWREAKLEIDIGQSIATLREVTKLLKELLNSPDHIVQAVVVGRRVIESAATYLGRPYVYEQMKTALFVDDAAPLNPLAEVIATAEWVSDQLLHEYRRLRDSHHVSTETRMDNA